MAREWINKTTAGPCQPLGYPAGVAIDPVSADYMEDAVGITADFLIKHIRPLDANAVATIFSAPFTTYLGTTLHMTAPQIADLQRAWQTTAMLNPGTQQAQFVTAADTLAQVRWAELYPTNASTVFYLTSAQLALLSHGGELSGPNRSRVIDFIGDPIRIAVTIRRNAAPQLLANVTGMNVSTDANANVVHLIGPA